MVAILGSIFLQSVPVTTVCVYYHYEENLLLIPEFKLNMITMLERGYSILRGVVAGAAFMLED